MRRIVVGTAVAVALAVAGGGCFTSWAITQAVGGQRILDEKTRSEAVPIPGVKEELRVRLPLREELLVTPAGSLEAPRPLPFALDCRTNQFARDQVHRVAFRYGSTWKKIAVMMLVIEAGIAASVYLGNDQDPGAQVVAGFFAADALASGVLALAPRKDVSGSETVPRTSPIRDDCPEGLELAIGGERYPVDAAGGVGEVGFAAIDGWMQQPIGRMDVILGDRAVPVIVGDLELCQWNRARHPPPPGGGSDPRCPLVLPTSAYATMPVPVGTLTHIAEP
ncbi:MAG: hypothetical protein KF773_18995 [Deltaproteobacteria bacterium]|nr:hypothetical protein [Deltaproteobacteria bacterium]MCW5802228.1 hypothetical protein [Deltaproteobacteria bacterium]